MPEHHYNPYDRLAPVYDWMASSLLLPFGGERRFRQAVLDAMAVGPGAQVLELGCGTGSMTRLLLDAGASVTSLELATPMLERAQQKAPGARFLHQDVLTFDEGPIFSHALLAFVLHEMSPETRLGALETAARSLQPGGTLGILEFADEAPVPVGPVFRAYLRLAEPELARDILAGALLGELEEAGLTLQSRTLLAMGTAQVLVARRPG